MATLKTYFLYLVGGCGIPEITIEGEKSDWENILARVDKLSYGAEPTHWANLLRPILRRFISAVDGDIDATFWSTICDRERGSGFSSLTGWITAFCVWDHRGKWHGEERLPPRPDWVPKREQKGHNPRDLENLVIDGVVYPAMNMGELPRGFASVELGLVPGDGPVIPTLLMAGHLGTEVAGENIRPYAAWLLVKQ